MEVLNALDLKSGKKAKPNRMSSLTQPLQFLPNSEKDDEWAGFNIDWMEWNGLKQIRRNAPKLLKNYKLSKGIIDKNDYIVSEDNEMGEIIDTLANSGDSALELKFYPIIPKAFNTLCSEFAKKNTKSIFRTVDEYSYNEELELKREQIEKVLFAKAEQKILSNLINAGADINDPEIQAQLEQQLNPENLKTLPEIQNFFNKDYRNIAEQWATHQMKVDTERFRMDELEERAFGDMLITDREFWHFKMLEDDYDIELWNPLTTFYHKSPDVRYISQGNWVGKIDMMCVADVIDKYGYLMTEEQLDVLEAVYPVRAAGYPITGMQNDGSYYDATKSHDWNVQMPGLAYRQYMSMWENTVSPGGDIINWIFSEGEDYMPNGNAFLLRVTTGYWKSQCKVGHLTKVCENGEIVVDTVSEEYKVIDKPIYDTKLIKTRTRENLIFGEHIDWIWINKVWGGVKIGPNQPTFWGMNQSTGLTPLYLGINQNKIGPLKFQFKGDDTLYGCKLPVEGAVFGDRNTKSMSMVDLMKPFQIGYNMVNNQIADILVDELGTVILLDHNSLPKHSMGEDWGKGNLAKAYVAMKNFSMLPLDTTIMNTENSMNFQHFQKLDLSQTERLLSRVQLANYFEQQCLSVIGLNPQRLGQQLGQTNTATGIEQAVTGSYAQTEKYFIQHSDYLMPRVHQMRTDLAQYYHCNNPSTRLTYVTSADEKVNFEINKTDLLLRDINIFSTTNANYRAMHERILSMVSNNNTTGASIYELGEVMQTETISEMNSILKMIDKKAQAKIDAERQQQQEMQQAEIDARLKEKAMELDRDAIEAEKNRRKDILVAEIRAAGMSAMSDVDKNSQNDYIQILDKIQQSDNFQQTMGMQQSKLDSQSSIAKDRNDIEREKMQAQMKMKEMDMAISRENQTRAELEAKRKLKEKAK